MNSKKLRLLSIAGNASSALRMAVSSCILLFCTTFYGNSSEIFSDDSFQLADSLCIDTSLTGESERKNTVFEIPFFQKLDSTLSATTQFDSLFTSDSTDSAKISVDSSVIVPKVGKRWSSRRKIVKKEEYAYPGISREQDKLALQMIHEIYSFDWNEAEKIAGKMQKLEQRNELPPLSYLLMVSMRVARIQNSEFEDETKEAYAIGEASRLAFEGMALANPTRAPKAYKATYLFIYSGIEGFSATLKIAKYPIEAAMEGFKALKLLEKLTVMEPQIKDAYLGLGIFYCALAKAPAIVRGALNIVGRDISFEKGVEYIRISAYEGRYTNETAKQYLIQFLSPYLGNEVNEKKKIFNLLERDYPKNPYYLFLEINEDICFHPDSIDSDYRQRVRKRISKFKSNEYSLKRYADLLLHQYCFIDPHYSSKPDSSIELREFSFYPYFLEALKEKGSHEIKRKQRYKRMNWTKNGAYAAKSLDESAMSLNRKNFFAWYLRDALRSR